MFLFNFFFTLRFAGSLLIRQFVCFQSPIKSKIFTCTAISPAAMLSLSCCWPTLLACEPVAPAAALSCLPRLTSPQPGLRLSALWHRAVLLLPGPPIVENPNLKTFFILKFLLAYDKNSWRRRKGLLRRRPVLVCCGTDGGQRWRLDDGGDSGLVLHTRLVLWRQ
jgi:hypothetical protein